MKKQWWKRSAAMLCSAAMLFGIGGGRPVGAVSENLITNSEFESNTSGWSCYAHSDADASVGWEEGALALEITALGSVNYAIQLSSNAIGIEQGKSYRVSFEISSTQPRYVDSIVQQSGSPYKAFAAQGIALTEEMQTVSYSFTMEDTDSEAKLIFNCGNHSEVLPSHTITLDNVVLEEVDPSEVEVYDPYEPPILINQLGYRPDDEKIAVFRDITSETEFSVIDADTQKTVCTGMLYGKRDNNAADEVNWYGDFSEVTAPGRYYITCGELDASYPFEIGSQVYDALLDDTVRMLYLQRCGCAVEDEAFAHPACHTQSATILGTEETIDVTGGWHDAGDFDLRVESQAGECYILALAYEAFGVDYDATTVDQARKLVEIHQPDGRNDILQQIEHGALSVVGGYRALGRLYRGIICNDLRQYVLLGDAAAMTDNVPGNADDRWVFTEDNPPRELTTVAQLAATARVLKGFNDGLAAQALDAAQQLYRTTKVEDAAAENAKIHAAAELLLTTEEDVYRDHLLANVHIIAERINDLGWIAARAVHAVDDPDFTGKLRAAMRTLKAEMDALSAETPYGIPYRPHIWGAGWDIQRLGFRYYFLHRAFPDIFGPEMVSDALNFILGCHPGSNPISFASGVGAESATIAYGANRADFSFIPGGVISGTALIRPDFPELLPWPFLWQQTEYVLGGGSSHYMFLALAVQQLFR